MDSECLLGFFFLLLPSESVSVCFPELVWKRENFSLGIALGFQSVLRLVLVQACGFYTKILKVNDNCLLLLANYVRKKKISQPTLPKHKLILQLLFLFPTGRLYDFSMLSSGSRITLPKT